MVLWLIIVGALGLHESAHVFASRFLGGRWVGIRIRWTRLAVIIQIPEGTPSVRFPIALAGLIVDAAALAGAQEMPTPDSKAPGDQATLVTQDDSAATHVVVKTQSQPPNTVLATAQAQVPGTFAALFGVKTFTVRARAVASYGAGPAFDYAVFQGTSNPRNPLIFNGGDTVNATGSSVGNVPYALT